MVLAFYLLLLAGSIGAYDVLVYHMRKCRLYRRPQSAAENVTHALRALIFASFFFVIMRVDARGAWWWLYAGLCAAEIVNSMFDTYLEKGSRADQGGLPNGEYCLHVLLSIIVGGAMTSMLAGTFHTMHEPTSLTFRELELPPFFRFMGYASQVNAMGFFLFEGAAVLVVKSLHARQGSRPA